MDCALYSYPSQEAAERVVATLGAPFVSYPCSAAGHWHVYRAQPTPKPWPGAFAKASQRGQGAEKFSCEGKRRYESINAARGDQGALKGKLRPYHCTYCKFWHNGSHKGK